MSLIMTTWKKYFFGLKRSRIISFRQIFIILLWIYLAGRMGGPLLSYKYDINLFVQKCNENYICAPTTMHFAFLTRSMRLLYHNLWETCLYILLLLTIPFILLYQVGQKSTFYAIFCSILILIYLTYTIAALLIPWKNLQRNAILMIMPVYMVWIW